MVPRLPKFRPGLVNMAVLIFLSGGALSSEPVQCYWCGPLGEQVHRSQRSPPCARYRAAACDAGYNYCATVVTEPTYTESRLCVKFYQDECYSLYCNTTKTWRMVCACKGNLCNGPLTDRETKAFATMTKQNKSRTKRALIANFISVKTKTPSDNNTLIIIHNKTADALNNVQDLVGKGEKVEAKHEVIIEHGDVKKVTEIERNDAYVRVNKTTTTAATETTESNTEAKIEKALEEATMNVENTSEVTIKESLVSKTSNKLPPPEALQQNVTATKPMEVTTMASDFTTATNPVTTEVNATKRNIGAQHLPHFLLISMILALHFS